MSNFEKIFKDLGAYDVSNEVKTLPKKQNGNVLKYLSWPKMVEILNEKYPLWSFRIHEFDERGIELPDGEHGFLYQKLETDTLVTEKKEVGKDGNGNPIYNTLPMINQVTGDLVYAKSCVGYNVKTSITIDDVTKEMWLYAMDSHSKPCKDKPYMVYPKYGDPYTVSTLTADILNKSIMRCLVKNAAMFGLGLNLYNGEDVPVVDDEEAYSEAEENSAKPVAMNQKQQPVKEAPKKVEPQPKFKPTATAKVEPVKQPVATPVQPTNVPKVNKVNAAEPVAKIPEMEQDTSLMNLNDALNTRAGNRTFQFYIDAGGVGLTPEQQKNSKARLISFSSRNDDIGKAARTILTALEKGECSFKQA